MLIITAQKLMKNNEDVAIQALLGFQVYRIKLKGQSLKVIDCF